MGEFMTVCRVDELPPGTMRVFQVGGEDITVANVDGAFHAIDDECTHKACSLGDGDLEGTNVVCPCHGSEFDVRTGEVVTPPATRPVATYEVVVENGEVRVSP